MTTIKRRLTIDVEFDVTDCGPEDTAQLERNLSYIPEWISAEGGFTIDAGEATVATWSARLERLP